MPQASVSPAPSRRIELDCLRGLAVLLVIFRHAEPLVPLAPDSCRELFRHLVRVGWVGVDLFFVLSGFLISSLLFRELDRTGRLDLGRFWIRRAFKILPLFWVYLAFVVAVETVRQGQVPWLKLMTELVFLQNYRPGLAGHTWSLAVEEHFYLLLPVLLWLWPKQDGGMLRSLRGLPWVFLVVAVGLLLARLATSARWPYQHATHLYPTHLRVDGLFAGVVLGFGWTFHEAKLRQWLQRWRWLAWGGVVAGLAPAALGELGLNSWVATFGLTGNFVGFGLLLILLLDRGLPTRGAVGAGLRIFAWGGAWSYGVYLWHLDWLGRLQFYGAERGSFGTLLILGIVGSFALGGIVTYCIERPCLRLRDRWFPSRSGGAVSASPAATLR